MKGFMAFPVDYSIISTLFGSIILSGEAPLPSSWPSSGMPAAALKTYLLTPLGLISSTCCISAIGSSCLRERSICLSCRLRSISCSSW